MAIRPTTVPAKKVGKASVGRPVTITAMLPAKIQQPRQPQQLTETARPKGCGFMNQARAGHHPLAAVAAAVAAAALL